LIGFAAGWLAQAKTANEVSEVVKRSLNQPNGPMWRFEVSDGEIIEDSLQPYCPVCEDYPLKLEKRTTFVGVSHALEPAEKVTGTEAECRGCGEYEDDWSMLPDEMRDVGRRQAEMFARKEGLI
jgi:hypothetical protein